MNFSNVRDLILETAGNFGITMLEILGVVLGIMVAFLVFKIGWGLIRNMPGDWGYNSQRKSYRFGRGKSVPIPQGGRII